MVRFSAQRERQHGSIVGAPRVGMQGPSGEGVISGDQPEDSPRGVRPLAGGDFLMIAAAGNQGVQHDPSSYQDPGAYTIAHRWGPGATWDWGGTWEGGGERGRDDIKPWLDFIYSRRGGLRG